MKVVLINFSGNVGKSTIATNMFASRMHSPQKFEVESLNTGGDPDAEKIKGKKFGELLDQIISLDSAIVDVAASNVEDFLKLMQQYDGSHEEFDYFVVPVVKEKKQQADTVNTLRSLAKIGIPKGKIRLLFNKVEMDDSVRDDFAALFGLAESEKSFTLRPDAVIYANEVFERLKSVGKSLGDITSDETDYLAKLRTVSDEDEKTFCVNMVALKRLGTTANRNLDEAFNALFN